MRQIRSGDDLQAALAEGYSGPATIGCCGFLHADAYEVSTTDALLLPQPKRLFGRLTSLHWRLYFLRQRIRDAWRVLTGDADLAEEDDD